MRTPKEKPLECGAECVQWLELGWEKSLVVTYESSTNKIEHNFVTFIHWKEVCIFLRIPSLVCREPTNKYNVSIA